MKKSMIDIKLLAGIFLAYLLIYITFDGKQVFWYLYTATMLFLISFTIINEKIDDEAPTKQYFLYGILSGALLYVLFFVGSWIFSFIPGTFDNQVSKIYVKFKLEWVWHYLVLIFVIIPGEEIFWRGFILKRLMRYMNTAFAIFIGASLNAAAFCFSGYPILIVAAFVSGIAWGILYAWKRSIPLLIISHLMFDLLLLVIFPLS
ncbi:CPBP family intramembrane metalloprotease [Bacillus sp. FJAT-49754]|uniref:CPBP family intramembrane metalloprotease n=2 Tax=Lederbergia citrea TaxID=2833581 RepID=A0A942UHA9_9BACI|nr:type II CAAX endopeptidase family protein [Lederbergia citrea]MBS4203976.1 CPBP family intramembrane metalloprotease [Lederbergia citrea]MBS4221440.1 CPBP family intramembrane metalloprotease [Lederbergia citrea]